MSNKLRRGLTVLAAAFMLFGVLTTTAYADLDSEMVAGTPHAVSGSNPGAGPDYWWRQGWGQTLYPDFAFNPPELMDYKVDGYIIGMLYNVDRDYAACTSETVSATSLINTSTPGAYYNATFGGVTDNTGPYGTNTNNTIDMVGIFYNPPTGVWPLPDPDAAQPYEGQWYMHYRYYSTYRYSRAVHTIGFGIDTTPPSPVRGLQVRTGISSAPVTGWQPLTRAHITWDPDEYDGLSGVGYYEVLIDDKPLVPESTSTPNPTQGRVYSAPWLPTPSSLTVENMPPGKHKISVVCVDRATNRSTAASAYYYSDPDVPTVAFTAPLTGYLKDTTYISVEASDSAGAPRVKVALDGSNIATFTAPPYRFKPNLTGVTPGPHVLTAIATDMMGRSVTTTLAVSTLGATVIPTDGYIPTDDTALNAAITGTTETNPNDPLDAEQFWRQGWGNTMKPQFEFLPPSTDPLDFGFVTGMLYTVNRTGATIIDPANPNNYFKSTRAEGTNLDQTVDLMGVYNYPPVGGWPVSTIGGEVQPYEGYWYFHFLPFTTKAYCPQNTSTVAFGIDVTKPRTVTGIKASPSLNKALAGQWTSASRVHVTWDADRYDDLSGVAYYKVLVDGASVIPAGTDSTQGRIYEVIGRTPTAVTIENMPAGKHKISVVAVDRATNEGPAASTYFYSDPDAPKVALLTPTTTIFQVKPSLTATASDLGGVRNVVYRLDGIVLGTTTAAPYALTPDLSGFAAGTHVLSVTATDMLGRTTVVSKTITLDRTPVKITNFSRNYSLFYPILRDSYYDNLTLKYTLNKSATVTIYIRDSAGTTRRTVSGSKSAGNFTYAWDGKWSSDSKAHTGTYYIQMVAKDSAGYTSTSPKLSTVIRNYELVKTGKNTVKVVPR